METGGACEGAEVHCTSESLPDGGLNGQQARKAPKGLITILGRFCLLFILWGGLIRRLVLYGRNPVMCTDRRSKRHRRIVIGVESEKINQKGAKEIEWLHRVEELARGGGQHLDARWLNQAGLYGRRSVIGQGQSVRFVPFHSPVSIKRGRRLAYGPLIDWCTADAHSEGLKAPDGIWASRTKYINSNSGLH